MIPLGDMGQLMMKILTGRLIYYEKMGGTFILAREKQMLQLKEVRYIYPPF
ncbi:hypothetical protein CANDROIZ_120024 [Candidatus Roizmanbacteria bacterium]|nr:hypothetical protein CANDROIZ_120024 [Candidatus Roizmanbacteria bacterium]